MSLGPHRGTALIGRPLDISVPAVLDAGDDVAALCAQADVFYADNKLSGLRIQVNAEKSAQASQDAVIRIRSSLPVNEPVVTLDLRLGCWQKTERHYVLLADLAPDVFNARGLQSLEAAFNTPAAQPNPALAAAGQHGGADSATAPATAQRRRPSRAPAATVSQGPADAFSTASAAGAGPGSFPENARRGGRVAREARAAEKSNPRLKLEALDLATERDFQLKSSAQLLRAPSSDPLARSAAAALWRALTAQPADILRDAEQLQALEALVQNLRSQSDADQLSLENLNSKIRQAQGERYANGLVYGLVALLLAALIALAYLARRVPGKDGLTPENLPWWRKIQPLGKGWDNSSPNVGAWSLPRKHGIEEESRLLHKQEVADPAIDLDFDLGTDESGSAVGEIVVSAVAGNTLFPLTRRDRSEFSLSANQLALAVKAEALFDIQQQADFFVSLGQHEQAIRVLRQHIEDDVQTSALVYLDLFHLYQLLRRQADYEALRGEFNQRFNANIPIFESYSDTGPGLEAHQSALTRIEALWPSPKVLEIIEESIFRRPEAGAAAFNLEAYRELLILYAVAREIISPEPTSGSPLLKSRLPDDGAGRPEAKTAKFSATSIQPLSASIAGARAGQNNRSVAPSLPAFRSQASPNPVLDLDLSEPPADGENTGRVVESDSYFLGQLAADVLLSPPASAGKIIPPATAHLPAKTENLIDFEPFEIRVDEQGKPGRRGS